MKELSIEEKATRYDEAIKRAKRMFSDKEIDYLFPELAESEDERTRKSIIEFFKNFAEHGTWKRIPDVTKWISWLENQCEQKSGDMTEPKFKVGDWITDNTSTFQIVRVENEWYHADDGDKICFDVAHQYYHLWTIKDAKEGDVLAYPDGSITLVKYMDEYIYMAHVLWVDGHIELNNSCAIFNVHPATKEQGDLLFKKMKEAGYDWEADKKELKRVEQKPTQETWNKEDEANLNEALSYIKDETLKNFIKDRVLTQAKQEWSEEDEHTMSKLLSLLLTNHPEMWAMFGNWLKCLKERYTWKPSEEQLIQLSNASNGLYYNCETLLSLLEQLKKLREE